MKPKSFGSDDGRFAYNVVVNLARMQPELPQELQEDGTAMRTKAVIAALNAAGLLILITALGCGQDRAYWGQPKELDGAELVRQYEFNEGRAADRYNGRRHVVTASPLAQVDGNRAEFRYDAKRLWMEFEDDATLQSMEEGETVRAECRVEGIPWKLGLGSRITDVVELRGCAIRHQGESLPLGRGRAGPGPGAAHPQQVTTGALEGGSGCRGGRIGGKMTASLRTPAAASLVATVVTAASADAGALPAWTPALCFAGLIPGPEPTDPEIQRECKSEAQEPTTAEGGEWELSV